MKIVTGLGYVDRQLANFQKSVPNSGDTTARSCIDSNQYGRVHGLSALAWIDQKVPKDPGFECAVLPPEDPPRSGGQTGTQQKTSEESVQREEWLDSSSDCSATSSSTTLSEAACKTHEQDQFAKLLSNSHTEESKQANVETVKLFSSVRKSLKRKLPIANLNRVANFVHTHDERRWSAEKPCRISSDKIPVEMSSPITRAPSKNDTIQRKSFSFRGRSPEACSTKPEVPQGRQLIEAQLTLQENILSQIADRAVDEAQRSNEDTEPERQDDLIASEGEPEDLDRELEVTRELMKQLRKSFTDGSYQDMYLLDDEGKEESITRKYKIACDILVMLRRAFRDILANFDRAYRPTGIAVTDQEMVKEMDEQLLARKCLMRRYPCMTMEDMLGNLGRMGHEANLKKLASL